MNFTVSQHNPSLGHILDGKFSSPSLPGQSPDGSSQVIALQSLHVLDLEAVYEQVVQSDDGQRVLHLEPADESL